MSVKIIATEADAYNIIGTSSSSNKCCTYARALEIGCGVNGSYSNNKLVCLDDLYKKVVDYSTIPIKIYCSVRKNPEALFFTEGISMAYYYGNSDSCWNNSRNITEFVLTNDMMLFVYVGFSDSSVTSCHLINLLGTDTNYIKESFDNSVNGYMSHIVSTTFLTNKNGCQTYGYMAFTLDFDAIKANYDGVNQVEISIYLDCIIKNPGSYYQ